MPKSMNSDRKEITTLIVIAVVTILLWHSPYGGYILWPFSILATWFHEMGHGLAAMMFGNDFDRLVIFPNGSGYALYYSDGQTGRVEQAIIAAAGLLGPTVAGCLLILASKKVETTRYALTILGFVLLGSTAIWVRSMTGWIVLPAAGLACLVLATRADIPTRKFAVQFLGVQGCISIYRDLGYLFSEGGYIDGQPQLSDTGQIERALLLPHWVWGGLITAVICLMVFYAMKAAHRR